MKSQKKTELDYYLANLLCEGIDAKVSNEIFDDIRGILLKKRDLKPLTSQLDVSSYNSLKILNQLTKKVLDEKF